MDVLCIFQTILLASLLMMAKQGASHAETIVPGVVYERGARLDNSLNEQIFAGLKLFVLASNIHKFVEGQVQSEDTRAETIRDVVRRGATHVIVGGSELATPLIQVANEFPNTRFTIIDAVIDLPNVQYILFNEHEGSYMVGQLAAMATKTGIVSFIGGMDNRLTRSFACGFKQGVAAVNKDIQVLEDMIGTTAEAWNSPKRAALLAQEHLDNNADVIYAAAGASSKGAGDVISKAGKLFIGADSNQNKLWPGSVLTSMLKRVDLATYAALSSSSIGGWHPGMTQLGLADGGINWSYDEQNQDLITSSMQIAMSKARVRIVAGLIRVHDYRLNSACPI